MSHVLSPQRFRDLTDARKEEYLSYEHYSPKQRIADEIYECITSEGGRFLRLVNTNKPMDSITEEGEWSVVPVKVAIEKIKQGLREKKRKKRQGPVIENAVSGGAGENNASSSPPPAKGKKRTLAQSESERSEGHGDKLTAAHANRSPDTPSQGAILFPVVSSRTLPVGLGSGGVAAASLPVMTSGPVLTAQSTFPSTMPMTLPAGYMGASVIDPRLLLFQPHPFVSYSQLLDQSIRSIGVAMAELEGQLSADMLSERLVSQYSIPIVTSSGEQCNSNLVSKERVRTKHAKEPQIASRENHNDATGRRRERQMKVDSNKNGDCVETQENSFVQESQPSAPPPDDDVSEYLLSMLSLTGRSKFTEQEGAIERANLTDRERAESLADLFGQMCSVDTPKKPRIDLGQDSIDFLLKEMRSEIEMIPVVEKQAMIEAFSKGRKAEFSDERLLKFLRCEGMNAKLAASRFAKYWEGRRKVFGSKYLERLTLAEALRDDLVALEAGTLCLLPSRDVSGRPIVYSNPSRHTREGYTSKSMLRAFWYIIEVVAEENTDSRNAFVEMVWNKDSSIFDYDRNLHDRCLYFQDNAWPIRCASIYVCCSPPLITRFLTPVSSMLIAHQKILLIQCH